MIMVCLFISFSEIHRLVCRVKVTMRPGGEKKKEKRQKLCIHPFEEEAKKSKPTTEMILFFIKKQVKVTENTLKGAKFLLP